MDNDDQTSVTRSSDPGPARTEITLLGGDVHKWTDEAWIALVETNDPEEPSVLIRGNALVRLTERGELEEWVVDSLRERISRVAAFAKLNKNGELIAQKPPSEVVRQLLARDTSEYPGAPRVDRVVDVPVVASGGSLITEPGYHSESRLIYRPAPGLENARPTNVNFVQEVVDSRELLMTELLGNFAWADESSHANALGLLLLPFVRELIDGPTPLHAIMAPEPGTGKSLLAQAALIPSCGPVPIETQAQTEDEVRKRLTATLMRGARAVVLDNIKQALSSGTFAAALTGDMWRDRVLGHSKEIALPIQNVWVVTGNSIDMSDELARRTVPIFLDPGDVRPSDRPKEAFQHPDLVGWAKRNRERLVSAALTLIRHWLEGEAYTVTGGHEFVRRAAIDGLGGRLASEQTLGSYESWANVIGGILRAADVPGFLGNRDRLMDEVNVERQELGTFLATWHERRPEPVDLKALALECSYGGILAEVVPTELTGIGDIDRLMKRLSYWLRGHRNRRAGGFQLLVHDGRPKRWFVRATSA